ncbi:MULTISPECIES: MOSC domain-containing protein [unclassified Ruegeria]|uniref:MOSC domain-containing protein n=1 Tax=unclassified Ruegeria TaxID=2625375 RepID=UPI001488147C|nr:MULTISPECIES: MOSC domain-containing protein [unclassified Ruegeria]
MTDITITRINRFPIKGLSAERLESVQLTAGDGIPGDRLYGFARHNSGFDPQNPKPLPKDRFVVLLKEAALAGLDTQFNSNTQQLEINSGQKISSFDMQTQDGRIAAATFLFDELQLSDPEPPVFVSSAPHRFTDVSVVSPVMMNAISVVNIASVKELGKRLGTELNPARFRANIEIDGLDPFEELEAVGASFKFGDATLRLISRTKRCAATEVNPETAERDLKLPYLLRKELGHMDMGVYVEVVSGGTIHQGDTGQLVL